VVLAGAIMDEVYSSGVITVFLTTVGGDGVATSFTITVSTAGAGVSVAVLVGSSTVPSGQTLATFSIGFGLATTLGAVSAGTSFHDSELLLVVVTFFTFVTVPFSLVTENGVETLSTTGVAAAVSLTMTSGVASVSFLTITYFVTTFF
jgi:hypothetical protein